jgi:predicted dehydrogenase
MKELRIGIIGCGMISHRHMRIWPHIPGATVVAACEIDEGKLRDWGAKYNIPEQCLYKDFREMLKRDDIDAIDVCVHNNLHTPVSVAVMQAGYPCYSEKPMAASYADAKILFDAQKKYGQKLAIQISSIFTMQTYHAKKLIDSGKLGKLYYARSVGHRREFRPGFDSFFFPADFISRKIAGRGALFDMGIYHLAQVFYLIGMPELESVYGFASADYYQDPRITAKGRVFEVEDLGVGLARFSNGVALDIYEVWAMHMDDVGSGFVAGSMGGLKLIDVDGSGGDFAMAQPNSGRGQSPDLEFHGYEDGLLVSKKIACHDQQAKVARLDPQAAPFFDNHAHWVAYLRDELTDETRVNTPYIAMQTALLSEGIFMSSELGRSVTADEIKEKSKSTAMRRQETPWGVIDYDF